MHNAGVISRRVLAGSMVASLLGPWLVIGAVAVHEALEHGHEHDLVDRVADAWHGHAHATGTIPHDHDAAPPSGKALLSLAQLATLTEATGVLVSLDPGAVCREATKRSPPQPPTASPPILRV
jgi:hypothetical protein